MAYYKSLNMPIVIKETSAKPYLTGDSDKKEVHFTVGDKKAYRIETDVERRTAECNFNNPRIATNTADFFDGLFSRDDSKEIDIVKLKDNISYGRKDDSWYYFTSPTPGKIILSALRITCSSFVTTAFAPINSRLLTNENKLPTP